MKKIILILLLLFAYSCDDQANKNPDNPMANPDNPGANPNNPSGFADRIGRVYYAATEPCKAGDYSQYLTGVKSVTIECDHDGKLSRQANFYSLNYNSPYLVSESLYRADGSTERTTGYYASGSKSYESLYRVNGSIERVTSYRENGNTSYEILYRADGSKRKYQVFDMSGTLTSTTYYDLDEDICPSPSDTKCVGDDSD